MIKGFNISPLPFYDSLAEQFANHPCAFGVNYPLLCGINSPLPFMFVVRGEGDEWGIENVALITPEGYPDDVTADFLNHGLHYSDGIAGGERIVWFMPDSSFTYTFPSVGNYYFMITTRDYDVPEGNTHTYFSEVFCVTDRLDDAIQITYTNATNILTPFGEIPFNDSNGDNQLSFRVWINALIGKPEYNFEEVETIRNGYSFMERCTSKKTYRFVFIAPEYLCDALRLTKLCSNVTILHRGKTYEPITLDMAVKWEEQGDLASVDISFDVDNIITAIGGYTET